MSSRRLDSYFSASPELRQLTGLAEKIQTVQQHYEQIVPVSLKQASRVRQVDGNTLMLVADNGAVAAKLRQLAPELVGLLQNRGCEVTGIRVLVQVSFPVEKPARTPARLNPSNRLTFLEAVRQMPESPLKAALRRLARNGEDGDA